MTKRLRDSMVLAFAIITGMATFFTVLGFSLKDILPFDGFSRPISALFRALILLLFYVILAAAISVVKYYRYRNSIKLKVGKNRIEIKTGNIFKQDDWRVIGMDTHFDTRVDDEVISKTSLHGQFVLEHANVDDIIAAVEKEAKRKGYQQDENGQYSFPLGTAISCKGKDGHYIMVALTQLNCDYEAHTKLSLYESTLMAMWPAINRVYEKYSLALPILGSGITRFDDHQDEPEDLLRCMLCTLNTSKVHFKSKINIIVYKEKEEEDGKGLLQKLKRIKQIILGYGDNELPLYEYRELFKIARR